MADNNFSPVPLGRANTGDALVLGEGLGALHYLEKTDTLRATARQRQAAAAAKQQDLNHRDFTANLKQIGSPAGIHFIPAVQSHANETYQKMLATTNDPSLNREQRAILQQQYADDHKRFATASVAADKYLAEVGRTATTDKRYDREKTLARLHATLYKDGQIISPLDYDPQTAETALSTGNEHLNGVEIYKNYLRGSHPDAVTSAREALPGGHGYRNVASSDVYELTPDGKIKYDTHTNLPVVKATPQALSYFDSDPVSRQWLDGEEAKHQQQLAGAVEKMQNFQQLTPEEAEAVRVEKSPTGRRMEFFKNGLMQQGYGRQSETILVKAAPRPRVGRAAKVPTNVVNAPTDFLPGSVLGGTGVNGTSGIATYGFMPALTYGKPGQEAKKYTAKGVKHQEVITQRSDGSPAEVTLSNQAATDVAYGSRHILLRRQNGTVLFPPKAALEAAQRGDFGPSEEFARQQRTLYPDAKPEWYVEATSLHQSTTQPGTKLKFYEQLKAAQEADGSLTKRLTDQQLHEKADREFGQQNATQYIRYRGQDKILIDQATHYALRNKKAGKAMDHALADADKRTRPQADAPRPITSAGSFYTPKLPKATKAAATRAAPKSLSKPATHDPYAL